MWRSSPKTTSSSASDLRIQANTCLMQQSTLPFKAAQQSNRGVLLVGGKTEQPRADVLAEQHTNVHARAGQWSLGQSALAIEHADAVVSGDTVTMHLAAALGTPLASVWGCTRPSLGLSAWRPHPKASISHLHLREAVDLAPSMEPPVATPDPQILCTLTDALSTSHPKMWPRGCSAC